MRTTEALWMANTQGSAALALAPLASAPSSIDLRDGEAVLALSCGAQVRIRQEDAEGVRRLAVAAGSLSVFEVDGRGNVRRSTSVGVLQ